MVISTWNLQCLVGKFAEVSAWYEDECTNKGWVWILEKITREELRLVSEWI